MINVYNSKKIYPIAFTVNLSQTIHYNYMHKHYHLNHVTGWRYSNRTLKNSHNSYFYETIVQWVKGYNYRQLCQHLNHVSKIFYFQFNSRTDSMLFILPHRFNVVYITTQIQWCFYYHTDSMMFLLPHRFNDVFITTQIQWCLYYHTDLQTHVFPQRIRPRLFHNIIFPVHCLPFNWTFDFNL